MSAENPHSPACILAGEITPLAISLSEELKKISCNPYFIPTKIHPLKKRSGISKNGVNLTMEEVDRALDGWMVRGRCVVRGV